MSVPCVFVSYVSDTWISRYLQVLVPVVQLLVREIHIMWERTPRFVVGSKYICALPPTKMRGARVGASNIRYYLVLVSYCNNEVLILISDTHSIHAVVPLASSTVIIDLQNLLRSYSIYISIM